MLHLHSNFFSRATALPAAAAALLLVAAPACTTGDKADLPKGVVDESAPPDSPFGSLAVGKADGNGSVAASLESAHPYTNNFKSTLRLDLGAVVPSCANRARVHFASLRTEAGYDFVRVLGPTGAVVQSFDGTRDNTWSEWVALDATRKFVDVRLESDYSITQYGFRIDAADYEARPANCPLRPTMACPEGTVDIAPQAGVCECPAAQQCVPLGGVELTHAIGGGFSGLVTGKRTIGTAASKTSASPSAGTTATAIGTVDSESLATLVFDIARAGLLNGPGRADASNWSETFSVKAGNKSVSFTAPAGSHTAQVAGFIARFDELTRCGELGDLTCASGLACDGDGECAAEQGCMCIALFQPVCGVNGATYGNACEAGCAGAAVKHDGACGIAGDSCGTIRGLSCLDDHKCRYGASTWSAPFPDAGGQCVARTYCDGPSDCGALPHPAVPGNWACETNACAWRAGVQWNAVANFTYTTARPYTNNMSEWKQLYLPDGAGKVRLVTSGAFALENGYDKLEVWVWQNNAWVKLKTYTGTAGPQLADVFTGRYFYLHFVSDSSVTAQGFSLTAQWSN